MDLQAQSQSKFKKIFTSKLNFIIVMKIVTPCFVQFTGWLNDSCFIYHNTKVTKSLTTNQLVYNNSFLQMQSVCKYPCTLQNVSFDTFGATFDNFSRDNQSLKFFENTLRVLCGYNSWPIWAQKMSKEASWMGLWHLPRKVVALHCWNESHQKFGYFITMKYFGCIL